MKPLFNGKNKTLMVQGTTSDAGKSVLVAGLCRVIARAGQLSVAPFKPQNMALNSAVTIDNGEIGRAQAVQAQACDLEPHTDMNPILLKPSSDTDAQVIVHGQAINSMQAAQFHDYKQYAMQAVLQSHQRLSEQYQRIIVEGAGSPAEINLRNNDIANMGFAEAVDCPVILVADIDRGGVFAHLVGTLELLSKSEQQRVVGFVINRFRGDIKLLEPGLDWLQQRTQKPVLGVLPYLKNFYLDAEDAISTQQISQSERQNLCVVVPVLPRISNHTDFDALLAHPQVELEFVSLSQAPTKADLIILPGSKNVRQDLASLKQTGWQQHLNRHCRYGGKIIGICGGYQMLGQLIEDPQGIEGKAGSSEGFALLDGQTILKNKKQLRRVSAQLIHPEFAKSPIELQGYEIHCGVTKNTVNSQAVFAFNDQDTDGQLSADNNVMGSYLHGLFDHPQACNALLKWAGLSSDKAVDLNQVREQQLERLADCIEEHLSTDFIQQLTQQVSGRIVSVEKNNCAVNKR